MKNCNEIRDKLSVAFDDLQSGKLTVAVGKEMINATGKIINSAKVQLEYYALIKEDPQIDFLKDDKE